MTKANYCFGNVKNIDFPMCEWACVDRKLLFKNQKIHITKFFGLFILYKKNGTSPRGSTRYDILMYEIVAS